MNGPCGLIRLQVWSPYQIPLFFRVKLPHMYLIWGHICQFIFFFFKSLYNTKEITVPFLSYSSFFTFSCFLSHRSSRTIFVEDRWSWRRLIMEKNTKCEERLNNISILKNKFVLWIMFLQLNRLISRFISIIYIFFIQNFVYHQLNCSIIFL
jgi:hypothetical protein